MVTAEQIQAILESTPATKDPGKPGDVSWQLRTAFSITYPAFGKKTTLDERIGLLLPIENGNS